MIIGFNIECIIIIGCPILLIIALCVCVCCYKYFHCSDIFLQLRNPPINELQKSISVKNNSCTTGVGTEIANESNKNEYDRRGSRWTDLSDLSKIMPDVECRLQTTKYNASVLCNCSQTQITHPQSYQQQEDNINNSHSSTYRNLNRGNVHTAQRSNNVQKQVHTNSGNDKNVQSISSNNETNEGFPDNISDNCTSLAAIYYQQLHGQSLIPISASVVGNTPKIHHKQQQLCNNLSIKVGRNVAKSFDATTMTTDSDSGGSRPLDYIKIVEVLQMKDLWNKNNTQLRVCLILNGFRYQHMFEILELRKFINSLPNTYDIHGNVNWSQIIPYTHSYQSTCITK